MWDVVLATRSIGNGRPIVADAAEALQRKKEISTHIHALAAKSRLHYFGKLTLYPSDPSELKEQCADAWAAVASRPPVACPLDETSSR